MTVSVRTATRDDVAAIAVLLADDGLGRGREAPGDPAYNRAFERMSAQAGNVYLVAEEGGAVVGCLQLTIIHGLSRAGMSRAQIEGVRVAESHRGQGLGALMFEAAFAEARSAGAKLVQLTTDRSRERAVSFYEGLGFTASHWGMKRDL